MLRARNTSQFQVGLGHDEIASVVGGQGTDDGIVRSKMISMLKVNPFRVMIYPLVEPVSMRLILQCPPGSNIR